MVCKTNLLQQNPYKKYQTGAETAKYYGISEWTLRRWRLQEGCPVLKIGGRFVFNIDSVESWLASREISGPPAEETDQVGVIREIRP